MQTLSQNLTETLRDWLLHGRLKPGELIEEVPLALTMGVSRTPVRAALATLASEGLIDHQPKRGYLVKEFALADILAAYEVRAVLEGLACRSAAQRGLSPQQLHRLRHCLADGDRILSKGGLQPEDHQPYQKINVALHNTLIEAAHNPWLDRFAEQAQRIPYASGRIVLWDEHPVILRWHGDHHRIVDAIVERDAARAEQLMREHVYYAGVILKGNFERLMARHTGHAGRPMASRQWNAGDFLRHPRRADVEDPWQADASCWGQQGLQPHQRAAIDAAARLLEHLRQAGPGGFRLPHGTGRHGRRCRGPAPQAIRGWRLTCAPARRRTTLPALAANRPNPGRDR